MAKISFLETHQNKIKFIKFDQFLKVLFFNDDLLFFL